MPSIVRSVLWASAAARYPSQWVRLPMIVAGNKCDLATDEQLAAFEEAMKDFIDEEL